MLVRFALLMLLALVPWTGMSSAAGSVSFVNDASPRSECDAGSENQDRSLDDPNVDTDVDRPITEKASFPDADSDDQSDNNADGMCRSETLELWFQPEGTIFIQALAATPRAVS